MVLCMVFGTVMMSCCIKGQMFCCYGMIAASVWGLVPCFVFGYLRLIREEDAPYG